MKKPAKASGIAILCALGWQVALAEAGPSFLTPRVDERVEVLSIAYSLATGGGRVASAPNPAYAKAINEHFARYSNHPLIARLKELTAAAAKGSNDLGSWEVPSLALHVGSPPDFAPLVPFGDPATPSDAWDDRTLLTPEFVGLLKRFYVDAKCQSFFKSQRRYYARVNAAYERGPSLNRAWLEKFFSLPATEIYSPVVSLLGLGPYDYIRVNFGNNRRNTHTVFASASFDEAGMPTDAANPKIARANLHEYIHAFTNQLIDGNLARLRGPAEAMLANEKVAAQVKGKFYDNWQFLLYESLVRACTIQYLIDNGAAGAGDKELKEQEEAGFFWMPGLVELLDTYRHDRQSYRDLSRFMPKVIEYFAQTAEEMKTGT